MHERTLRILYKDNCRTFDELFVKDGSISIHHRNIHAVALEMYKFKQGLSPELIKDIFVSRTHQDRALRSNSEFQVPKVKTVKNGHESQKFGI